MPSDSVFRSEREAAFPRYENQRPRVAWGGYKDDDADLTIRAGDAVLGQDRLTECQRRHVGGELIRIDVIAPASRDVAVEKLLDLNAVVDHDRGSDDVAGGEEWFLWVVCHDGIWGVWWCYWGERECAPKNWMVLVEM